MDDEERVPVRTGLHICSDHSHPRIFECADDALFT
jgi:hypothetical protein